MFRSTAIRVIAVGVGVLQACLAAGIAHAGPILVLSSSSDLSVLTVGDTVTVDIELSGLSSGDTLEFLAATSDFNPALFGTPAITPGPVIPDLSGFLAFGNPGTADASYDSLFAVSGAPIASNGTFFSFDVTAQAAGSGAIEFSFVDSIGFDAAGNFLDPAAAGSGLQFSVSSPATPIPEPTSLTLLAMGAIGVPVLARRRRRTQLGSEAHNAT